MGARAFSDFMRQSGIELSLQPDGLSHKDADRLMDALHSRENRPMIENNCYAASEEDIRDFTRQLLSR